jgi:succinylglutamate desuccinylase
MVDLFLQTHKVILLKRLINKTLQRIIGQYDGDKHGDLIIAIGAIHGNEPAGVHALQLLFDMLQKEPSRNPAFRFAGRLVGVVGNIQALERRTRFVKKDLNRQLTTQNIATIREQRAQQSFERTPQYNAVFEDSELIELIETIEYQIETYKPNRLIVLDLHTTSADGGIFSIVSDDPESVALAETLHAPVVLGMIGSVGGSTLHYFIEQNIGIPTIAVAFESGKHDDLYSARRAVAWLVHALRSVGAISTHDVENRHEIILKNYSNALPKIVQLVGSHPISATDEFKMFGNFRNFQPVRKGEILAKDRNGFIVAPQDCRVLMPLYQTQGSDGFFLVI